MNGQAFGCGQCLPCRVNRRRIWTHRIMLEAAQYHDNSFVTLTYDEEKLPVDLSVTPRTLQLFMKRLRKVYPNRIRYFGVGEYGDQTMRPHYHLALFNFASCARGQTVASPRRKSTLQMNCPSIVLLLTLSDVSISFSCLHDTAGTGHSQMPAHSSILVYGNSMPMSYTNWPNAATAHSTGSATRSNRPTAVSTRAKSHCSLLLN